MITKNQLQVFSQEAEREVRENILPFWLGLVDRANGGFFGEVSFSGEVRRAADKGGVLCARLVWTFSQAFLRYQDPAYLAAARHACRFLLNHFWDEEFGGTYYAVDYRGLPADTRKLILPQAFTLYGLAEYYRATREPMALSKAIETFELIERHSHDELHGGYHEGFERSWNPIDRQADSAKAMDPHLRVMMGYANLLSVWDAPRLRLRLREIVEIFLDHLINPETNHIWLSLRDDWQPTSANYSFGHDIELVWQLSRAANVLGDGDLSARVTPAALRLAVGVLRSGVDSDGSLLGKGGPGGLSSEAKDWWPQAESVVGFLNAYQLSGDEKFYQAARKNWEWIQSYLVDRDHGDWYAQLTRERQPAPGRNLVDSWKCPYHNSRCCFEIQERIEKLLISEAKFSS
jgi:cellobiose epimerase